MPSAALEPRSVPPDGARGRGVRGAGCGALPVQTLRSAAPDPAGTRRLPRGVRPPPRAAPGGPGGTLGGGAEVCKGGPGAEPGAERSRRGQLGGMGREGTGPAPGELPPPRSAQRPGRDFAVCRVGAESNLSGVML